MNHGCRKCRREGVKLFLKGERCFSAKCPISKRPYAPGQHGPTSFVKLSEYGKQLREKQKAKRVYGLSETQLKNYYLKSGKKGGDTSENLIQFLEMRLDSIIYRVGLCSSRSGARQLVNHGFSKINNTRADIPSIITRVGDNITIKKGAKIQDSEKSSLPSWLSFDSKKMAIEIKKIPAKEEIDLPFDINLIIEFYSR